MGQRMGYFDVDDPSECDKPKHPGESSTPADFLASGAAMCCKSKEVDQRVCKSNKCVAGMMKCFSMHGDFEKAESKITNPKAIERDDDGKLKGDNPNTNPN